MVNTFEEEVDEDLRREQIVRLWKKYGLQAIGVFVAAILIAAAAVGWRNYQASKTREASMKYQDAVAPGEAATAKPPLDRIAELDNIEKDLTSGYKLLARFERASALLQAGRIADAAKVFDGIAADSSVDASLRNVAQLKASALLADQLSLAEMKARLEKLAAPDSAFRFLAGDLLGYSAFRVADLQSARNYYQSLTSDLVAPPDIKARAQDMLDEIEQRLPAAAPAKAPAADVSTKASQ